MSAIGIAQIVVFLVVLTALVPLVGGYLARVYSGEATILGRVLGPLWGGFAFTALGAPISYVIAGGIMVLMAAVALTIRPLVAEAPAEAAAEAPGEA